MRIDMHSNPNVLCISFNKIYNAINSATPTDTGNFMASSVVGDNIKWRDGLARLYIAIVLSNCD